jgi:hypothetical protein
MEHMHEESYYSTMLNAEKDKFTVCKEDELCTIFNDNKYLKKKAKEHSTRSSFNGYGSGFQTNTFHPGTLKNMGLSCEGNEKYSQTNVHERSGDMVRYYFQSLLLNSE